MTDFRVESFLPQHAYDMELEDKERWMSANGFDQFVVSHYMTGPAWTLFKNDRIVTCGGISIYWQGVGEAWVLTSPLFYENRFTVHRLTRAHLAQVSLLYKLHRVQAVADPNDPKAVQWLETLGFTFEGLMRKYGPDGRDYKLYARLF